MSHGRHAYNRAKRRGGFTGRGQFEDCEFRDYVSISNIERLWNELDDCDDEDEINDEWYGEEESR